MHAIVIAGGAGQAGAGEGNGIDLLDLPATALGVIEPVLRTRVPLGAKPTPRLPWERVDTISAMYA
jgi:hypothetical protein